MAREMNISVALRCRPLLGRERLAVYPMYLRGNTVSVDRRLYNFDRVFDQRSKNETIFKELVFDKIDDLIQGYNVAFMTYGPTKTGKSYTMGTFYDKQLTKDAGIIPRTVREIFKRIRKDKQYSVKVSFVEVIHEEVHDLLVDPTEERVVKENDARDAFEIEGLLEIPAKTADEALDVLAKGISTRKGITNAAKNLKSPRAHLLYTLTLEVRQDNLPIRVSKVYFVEIGTDERVSSPEPRQQKTRRGRPLLGFITFNKIINYLTMDKKILPYRESKLTSILKETLGGNCITVLIVCVCNAYGKVSGFVEPIRISSTARRVVNKPIINTLSPEEQIRFIEREAENNERKKRQEAERKANKKKNKKPVTKVINQVRKQKTKKSEIDDPKTLVQLYEEREREEARMKRSQRNEDQGKTIDGAVAGPSCSGNAGNRSDGAVAGPSCSGNAGNWSDGAVAGPSCSGNASFCSDSEEREIDYLYIPEALSEPEQIDEDYEDDDPDGYFQTYGRMLLGE